MSKTICSLPFTHLATHPHGGVTLCCVSDHVNAASNARTGDRILSLNKDNIDSVMNSDFFKQVRCEMTAGLEPKACTRCYDEERAGIKSKRQEENARYLENSRVVIDGMLPDGTINVDFRFIELRLGNICNLRCRTCNPVSSSKWIAEYSRLQNELKFVTDYSNIEKGEWFEQDEFWDDLLEKSNSLRRIYVNGGEPTMVKKHFRYLEMLIERGLHKQVELWYNINLTQVPDELVALWKQFKKISVSASIDDLDHRNSYIRSGSDWNTTLANLQKLRSYEFIDLSIVQTISTYSAMYLPEFYDFFSNQMGLHVHLNWCYDPGYLSPWTLPESLKKKIIEDCRPVMRPWDLHNVTQTLSKPSDSVAIERFLQYTKWLDSSRNEKFETVFPELAAALQ
jgi:organic radical activating enzyme